MGRIGMPELLVILVIVIVIFGANRLPGLGRGIGNAIKNFKDEMKDKDDKDKDEDDKRNRRAS
jgi:sec-independent protein translocase protein TatA